MSFNPIDIEALADGHDQAISVGKPQEVEIQIALHMGAFEEGALSPTDALESIHDEEAYDE